jgi:hypothetical protein
MLRTLLLFAFATMLLWPVIDALRYGKVSVAGTTVMRKRRPIAFWLSLVPTTLAALFTLALAFGIWPPR